MVVFLREEKGEDKEGEEAALPPRATETGTEGGRSACASAWNVCCSWRCRRRSRRRGEGGG